VPLLELDDAAARAWVSGNESHATGAGPNASTLLRSAVMLHRSGFGFGTRHLDVNCYL
jgi:hypothetical protein